MIGTLREKDSRRLEQGRTGEMLIRGRSHEVWQAKVCGRLAYCWGLLCVMGRGRRDGKEGGGPESLLRLAPAGDRRRRSS